MAGRRHHHLWQLLQRGFSWRENDDDHIWVYKKGMPPKQTVTRKFGRIKDFYGPEGSLADENITTFEGSVQSYLQDVRRMPNGELLSAEIIAPLIAHLEMRSVFLREEIYRVSDQLVDALQLHFSSEVKLKLLLSTYVKTNPHIIEQMLEKESIPKEMWPIILEFISHKLPEVVTSQAEGLKLGLQRLLSAVQGQLVQLVKDSHIKSLESKFSDIGRTKLHSSLNYRVMRSEAGGLILPDTALTFFKDSGLSPISQVDDKIEGLVIPLSSSVAIIGSSHGTFVRDIPTFQRALASCSYEGFVADRADSVFMNLTGRIGRNSRLISDGQLQTITQFSKLIEKVSGA